MWSWSLLLLGFVTVSGLVVGPAQPVPIQCRGYSLSLLFLSLRVSFISLSAFCLFYLWSYSVPVYWVPLGGLCIADTRRDE